MRFVGNYDAAQVASFADLLAEHTNEVQETLAPLTARVEDAIAAYQAAWPDVCGLAPIALTKAERASLMSSYDNRTVAIKRLLASMLETLAPEHRDLCPYCNLDSGAELDHYLPKDVFAEFSLNAANLVPVCGKCNRKKSSTYLDAQQRKLFLLPLFDLAADIPFLKCEIAFQPDVSVSYYVDEESDLAPEDYDLCARHFRRLDLADRFSKRAIGYLSSVRSKLRTVTRMEARRVWTAQIQSGVFEPTNSWRPALYRTASDSIDGMLDWMGL